MTSGRMWWPKSRPRRRPDRRPGSAEPRSLTPVVVLLALTGLFCSGVALSQVTELPSLSSLLGGADRSGGPALGHSIPTGISIPALHVRAKIVEVGRADDGSIATPAEDPAGSAGWYVLGPTPGERGTSVIVGHVDTEARPALFHRLDALGKGEPIQVFRRDHSVATFRVDAVRTLPKTSFPAHEIFARTDRARLVLVTCGGQWLGGEMGYADNVIVFATLA